MKMSSWGEPIESFGIHIYPEKDEQLKDNKIGEYSSPKQHQSLQHYWRFWNSTRKTKRLQYKALLSAKCYSDGGFLWHGGQERLRSTLLIPELGINNKGTKITKPTKNKSKDKKDVSSMKNSEIAEFIQDFHRKYQSLHSLYHNLSGEVREKVHGREEDKEGYSCSTSSLDSESYYSPYETTSESGSEPWKVIYDLMQKLETSNLQVTDLRNKLMSMSEEKEALNLEYVESLSKIRESEKTIQGLRIEAEHTQSTKRELVDECSQLKEKLEERERELLCFVHESEAAARVKELESQVTSLKLELETLCTEKKELEEQIQHRATQAKQARDKNLVLESRILVLETASREKEDEHSALHKKFEENVNYLMSRIEDLMAQSNNLQMEVCKSNETSAQVKDITEQLNVWQEEPESLSSQKSESESNLEKQTLNEQRMVEDKEGLKVQVKELKLEVELKKKPRCINHEVNQMRVQKEGLHIRIFDSFKTERSQLELQNVREKQESLESLTQLEKHKMQNVREKQESLESLIQLEKHKMQNVRQKQESLESLTQLEKHKIDLTSKIAGGHDNLCTKLNEDHILIKVEFLQIQQRKIEEMAEEFCKKFEDHLRPLSHRIRVAEQLHTENKVRYRKIKERFEQEHVDLKERAATNEVAIRKSKDNTVTANDVLRGLDSMVQRFEHCSANLLNQISKVSCEVKFAKDWVRRKNNAIKHVKEDADCLLARLDAKEAEICGFRECVWKLENKVRELEKMVKDKEEGMLCMGEEKREAIRQLCLWIDYHRNHSDYLKKLLSVMTVRTQRRTWNIVGH